MSRNAGTPMYHQAEAYAWGRQDEGGAKAFATAHESTEDQS